MSSLGLRVVAFLDHRTAAAGTPDECSRCGYDGIVRSRARWYDYWRVALWNQRPFRCVSCRHRMWGHADQAKTAAAPLDRPVAPPDAPSPIDLNEIDSTLAVRSQEDATRHAPAFAMMDWQVVALVQKLNERMREIATGHSKH